MLDGSFLVRDSAPSAAGVHPKRQAAERCGAIKAAKETLAAKSVAPGHIQSLVKAIAPAVLATTGADVEATAKANVLNVAQALRGSDPILKRMIDKGTVSVVGAHYDLDTGAVEFLKDAPPK